MTSLDLLAMLQFADIQAKSSYVMIFAAMRACATGGVQLIWLYFEAFSC